jgi:hypothetical protein
MRCYISAPEQPDCTRRHIACPGQEWVSRYPEHAETETIRRRQRTIAVTGIRSIF